MTIRPEMAGGTDEPRILAVDDEPRGVELLARTLRKLGRVESADSGEAAWELLQRERFDLVISDQRMPGMSGVELLTRVADEHPFTGRMLLTGYADHEATVDAINLGRVHAYLSKPCAPDPLRMTARAVLEQTRLARENHQLVSELSDRNRRLEGALADLEETQQRVVEAERLSAIGGMVAAIVHDFRSPLAVIGASARELCTAGDASVAAVAASIAEEAERVERMGNELLEMTRVSAGPPDLVVDEVDEVVESALAALSHDASVAGVTLETELRAGARLPLDEARMRRAILNLGYNALDAMPEGGTLRVSSTRHADGVTLSFHDSGPGVPEELAARIFEPFVSSGKPTGTGLGLAIVKRVVEDHGGRIELAKGEGGGAAFHLHLPLIG